MAVPIKYDELSGQWTRKIWKQHYLFTGQEDFLIDQAAEIATRHWLGENPDSLSLDRLDADSQSLGELLQVLQTAPFFGGQRVIRIQNSGTLTVKEQQALATVLGTLGADTHCLLIWGKEWRRDDATKPLVEAMGSNGLAVIFWPLFPSQAERWVLERARIYKKTLSAMAAHWLVENSGDSLRMLDQELAKCSAFVGERPALELDDVQASFGYEKASSPFDWTAAIRQKAAPASLQILDRLLSEGEEPVRLLALLSRTVRDWFGAKGSGENAMSLAMRFRIRRGEENKFFQELARWSENDLSDAIGRCVDTEQSIKTGKETPEMALTLLTLGLCGSETSYAGRQA